MQTNRRQALLSIGVALLPVSGLLGAPWAGPLGQAGAEALLDAVRRGDLSAVRKLLGEDANLARATDAEGRSAFVLAHLHGHPEVAQLLLETGLELDVTEAVLAKEWGRVEALVAADPGCVHRNQPVGGNLLYAAALVGDLEMWRLRGMGCDPNGAPAGGSGWTPARGAMEARRDVAALVSATDLLSNGGDVNAAQRGGDSVLHGAVRRRDPRLVALAIRKGARVELRDDAGRTAAELAEELGWGAGAALLAGHARLARDNRASRFAYDASRAPVERPDLADVPQELQSEVTGSSHMNLERVRELVSSDPRLVFSISTDDELAIEASGHMGNVPIMSFHLDHGAPLSLPTAVSMADADAAKFLLDRDPTLIHERGAHDFPVLVYAALGVGGVAMAELLTARGASLEQESMGCTALHWGILRRRKDLVAWLLEQGADANAVSYRRTLEGETPLQLAELQNDRDLIALVKAAGGRG